MSKLVFYGHQICTVCAPDVCT